MAAAQVMAMEEVPRALLRLYSCIVDRIKLGHVLAQLTDQFQIRLCPALAQKPMGNVDKDRPKDDEPKTSPFQPPYIPDLYVGSLEGVDGEKNMSVLVSAHSPS